MRLARSTRPRFGRRALQASMKRTLRPRSDKPGLQRLALFGFNGQVRFGWRFADFVELLNRGGQHFGLVTTDDGRLSTGSMRSTTRPLRT